MKNISLMFYYMAQSFNLYKWGSVILRAYVCSGNFTVRMYKLQRRIEFVIYGWFVLAGLSGHVIIMSINFRSDRK